MTSPPRPHLRAWHAGDLGLAIGGAGAAAATGLLVGSGATALAIAVVAGAVGIGFAAASPARCALLALVALPWLFYPATVGTLSLSLAVPVAAVVIVFLLFGEGVDVKRFAPTLPRAAFGVLAAVAVLAAALSENVSLSLSRVFYLVLFGLFARALFGAITSGRITGTAVARAIVVGGVIAAIAVTAQVIYGLSVGRGPVTDWLNSVYPAFGGTRAAGIATRNWYVDSIGAVRGIFPFMAAPSAGQYLMLALIAAVWLRRSRSRGTGVGTSFETAAIAIIATGLLMTFSRQAWVGAFVGLLALATHRRGLGALVVAGCGVALLLVLPLPSGSGTFGTYLISASDTATVSSNTRLGLLSQAVHLVPHHALIGVGPGLFGTLNPDPADPIYYAHNVTLDVAVETGIVGAIAFVSGVVSAIRAAWRRGAMLAFALLVAFFVASMFDDVLYFPRNGLLVAAAVALIGAKRDPADQAASAPTAASADARLVNGPSSASSRPAAV